MLQDTAGNPPPENRPLDDGWFLVGADLPTTEEAVSWATTPATGAVVVFVGVVREDSAGYAGVTGIDYEVYDSVALRRLAEVADEALRRWPAVQRTVLWHRSGRVPLGEPSVHVVVSSGHRECAFAAAEFCIDVIKASVPAWKFELAESGSGWAEVGVDAVSVSEATKEWSRMNPDRLAVPW